LAFSAAIASRWEGRMDILGEKGKREPIERRGGRERRKLDSIRFEEGGVTSELSDA
jgi:hypothetical protein